MTTNGGQQWDVLFDAGPRYYRVMTAALAPGEPGVVYASVFTHGGPMSGDLFRIDQDRPVSVTGTLPRLPVAVTVDPRSPRTVYAVLHGYGVYRSTDAGESWSELSGASSGLPVSPPAGPGRVTTPAGPPTTLPTWYVLDT